MSGNLRGKEEYKARLRAISLSFKPIGRTWADKTVPIAKDIVPVRTGRLRASFRRRLANMKRATVVGHYTGYFVDAGPVPHTIKAKTGGTLVFRGRRGTVFARAVHHRGYRARPFRRRAAEEGLRRTPMADIVIRQWNSVKGRSVGGLHKAGRS